MMWLFRAWFCFFLLIPAVGEGRTESDLSAISFQKVEVNGTLNAFMQDSDGFFWMGLQNGLSKYDGYNFTLYEAGPDELSTNWISALYEDKEGVIWIGAPNGLTSYNKQTNQFAQYYHQPNVDGSISSNEIQLFKLQAFAEDKSQRLWVATSDGINRFNRETNKFTRIDTTYEDGLAFADQDIWSILPSAQGWFWVGTANGIHKFNPDTGLVTERYISGQGRHGLLGKQFSALLEDSKGVLWVASRDGFFHQFDSQLKQFALVETPISTVGGFIDLLEDDSQRIWLSHYGGGLLVLDAERKNITHINYDESDPNGVSGSQLISLHQDQLGDIWVTDFSGTLNRYSANGNQFVSYAHQTGNENSLSKGSYVGQLIQDKEGIFWIAVAGAGLDRYDPVSHQFTHYRHDPKDKNSLPESFGQSVFEDSEGRLWVGTINYICEFDRSTEQVKQCLPSYEWPSFPLEDKTDANILWFGSWGVGLIRLDKRKGELSYIRHDPDNPKESLTSDMSIVTFQDDDGVIFVGTFGGGLNLYDPVKDEVISQFRYDPDDEQSINSDSIYHVFKDSQKRYWIGTDSGLNLFDREAGTFKRFTKSNGSFPLTSATAILEDSSGKLWISSNRKGQIIQFDPTTHQYKIYSSADGVHPSIGIIFNPFKALDGGFWFVGYGGVTQFYPDKIKEDNHFPSVYFTSLTQEGEVINSNVAIENSRLIDLDWRNNFFEFSVAAINFRQNKSNQYRWKLEGVDKGWFEAGGQRSGRYSGLPSGEYTLKVQGSNHDGVWSDELTTLKVNVEAAFWQTRYFKIFVVVAILVLVSLIVRWRFSSIKKQRENLEEEVESRTLELALSNDQLSRQIKVSEMANAAKSKFLANMSHELRTPLNGILGYAQILQNDKNVKNNFDVNESVGMIKQSGDYLLTIINDILDLAKVESGKLELITKVFNFQQSVKTIVSLIEMKATAKGLAFECVVDDDLPDYINFDEKRLRQVLLNLLGNAIKFTISGKVCLSLQVKSDTPCVAGKSCSIRFKVSDTGIGIKAEELRDIFRPFEQVGETLRYGEGTGLGLSISQNFVHHMGGELKVESKENVGTDFWFDLSIDVAEGGASDQVSDSDNQIVGYKGKSKAVLIVDDYDSNRNILKGFLQPLGFKVMEAKNGKDGVEQAKLNKPDIIFMDMKMPVMNGLEATKELRRFDCFDDVVIIAVTASVYESDVQHLLDAGCDAFLPKPIYESNLLQIVADMSGIEWKYEHKKNDGANLVARESSDEEVELLKVSGCNVLVVDDNPVNQAVCRKMLTRIGVKVAVAENGQTALDQAFSNNFSLILMDIHMPVMGGVEATRKLREKGLNVPIIAVSAENDEGAVQRFISSGCDGYLEKPIDYEKLKLLVKNTCKNG